MAREILGLYALKFIRWSENENKETHEKIHR